jgi:hypothetical protein
MPITMANVVEGLKLLALMQRCLSLENEDMMNAWLSGSR